METTAITEQLPAVTDVTNAVPALTDVTNGLEVFMHDVAQANGNQATFFDSVARYANNIIDAISSTGKYFVWIHDIADTLYNSDYFPIWFCSAAGVSLFFLLLNFIRNR